VAPQFGAKVRGAITCISELEFQEATSRSPVAASHPDSGIFYLRRVVPEALKPIVGKSMEKVSLGTRAPAEARIRHAVRMADLELRASRRPTPGRKPRRGRLTPSAMIASPATTRRPRPYRCERALESTANLRKAFLRHQRERSCCGCGTVLDTKLLEDLLEMFVDGSWPLTENFGDIAV
jgi:hypothetical protein